LKRALAAVRILFYTERHPACAATIDNRFPAAAAGEESFLAAEGLNESYFD